ncbi:hypothetical protein [Lelliottia wanjuensis]|uniref:hypothetical protein n=1 Tax=Lelliottia wanjuensis TaxID=3050585 RepID=UPI00254EB6C3|nr:hypothetical protein [Lelliottia sp. V86_10]MDK9585412.1 hypothetical protein [Lelliottia sp. V86_10]
MKEQGSPLTLIIMVSVILFFNLVPAIRIARKAGYGWGMAIALSIPGVSLLAFWSLAFFKWPNEDLLKHVRRD